MANRCMKNRVLKDKRIYKVIMVFVFVFIAGICQAQKWSDMTYWLSTERGAKQLAELAHPMHDYIKHSVVSTTSDYIIIEIRFASGARAYWSKYKVYKGVYHGEVFFKDIDVLSEGSIFDSFNALEKITDIRSEFDVAPDEVDEIMRYFHNCTWYVARGEYRAALLLSSYCYDYYN